MFLDNFPERLKEERVRLDLNQSEFGELCGVKKLAQFHYEKGDRFPDVSYLMQALRIGVDVNYLLTGQRTITTLSNEEVQVINMYREADVQAKKDVLGVLFATGRATVGVLIITKIQLVVSKLAIIMNRPITLTLPRIQQ
jgi:transcriptional regulator with XRE-family HTH domain